MSRRDQIQLTPEEQLELLDSERVVIISSIGPRGWPHSMPMWFVVRDGEIWVWTYAKSQKVKNLERNSRATLLIETGHEYQELRGIQIEAEAELIRETDEVFEFAKLLTVRYAEGLDRAAGRGRGRAPRAGPEAGRDPLPAGPHRDLGPPQARRDLLAPMPVPTGLGGVGGVELKVRTGSSREGIDGTHDGAVVVRVAAKPVEGQANKAVRKLIAKKAGVAARPGRDRPRREEQPQGRCGRGDRARRRSGACCSAEPGGGQLGSEPSSPARTRAAMSLDSAR